MTLVTGSVHFARCDAGEAYPWAFFTPDRTVAVPYMGRCAGESLTSGNDRNLQDHVKQEGSHSRAYHVSRTLGQVRSLLYRRDERNIPHILGT